MSRRKQSLPCKLKGMAVSFYRMHDYRLIWPTSNLQVYFIVMILRPFINLLIPSESSVLLVMGWRKFRSIRSLDQSAEV